MTLIRNSAIAVLAVASGFSSAADGDLDASFGTNGKQTVVFDGPSLAFSATLAAGNKLYVVGSAQDENADSPYGIGIARLLKDGTPDDSYGTNGQVFHRPFPGNMAIVAAALQTDGKLLVAGTAEVAIAPVTEYDMVVCRFDAAGEPDLTFGYPVTPGCSAFGVDTFNESNDFAEGLAVQPDGKIVVVGSFADASLLRAAIVRLLPNGKVEESPANAFGENGRVIPLPLDTASSYLNAVTVAADGDIIAAGSRSPGPGDTDMMVVRINPNGAPDELFGTKLVNFDLGPPGSRNDEAYDVHVYADDSILVSGAAQLGTQFMQMAVARLTRTGTLDTRLGGTGKITRTFCDVCDLVYAYSMAVQSDGRIVLAGAVSEPGIAPDFAILRLMPDGSTDGSFGGGGAARVSFDLGGGLVDRARSVVLQNGRIVVAGAADAPGADNRVFAVARLENDLIFADGFKFDD